MISLIFSRGSALTTNSEKEDMFKEMRICLNISSSLVNNINISYIINISTCLNATYKPYRLVDFLVPIFKEAEKA